MGVCHITPKARTAQTGGAGRGTIAVDHIAAGEVVAAFDGLPRRTYLYQVVDNEWTMREFGHQAVVWQTAVHPVVALEMLATGEWKGAGVKGPEAFRPFPFLQLLDEHGAPWAMEERTP